jgi:hypothetical protein
MHWSDPRFLTQLISVPLFTGVIMLFQPMRFHGVRVPGPPFRHPYLPRRVQVIPAITHDGRFGWQGIIPSRVSEMASISVDKALLKVGSIGDLHRELEPDKIADHLAATAAVRDSRRGRPKTVRGSIHMTPFGEDFCQTCLPLDD